MENGSVIDALTEIKRGDRNLHQWCYAPNTEILERLLTRVPLDSLILEIGPGLQPFPRATHFIDVDPTRPNCRVVDIDREILPFPDRYSYLV